MGSESQKAVSDLLKTIEKARKEMFEVVAQAPNKEMEKEAQKLLVEVQQLESKVKKLIKNY